MRLVTGRRSWLPTVALLGGWVVTRTAMVAIVHWSGYPSPGAVTGDTRLYASWATILRSGHFPAADPSWQYPPGAAGVLVVPAMTGAGYHAAFVAMMLIVDLGVLLGLLYRGRRGGGTAAAWTWLAGIAAVGPVALNRFDLVPTALAVAGVLAGSPYAAGALLGLGGLVKLWPAVLIAGVRERWVPVRTLATMLAIAVAAVTALAGVGRLGEALGFAGHTRDRGLQIESVAATPYLLLHALFPDAGELRITRRFGAYEVVGRFVSVGITLTTVATVVGLAAYTALAIRARRSSGPGDPVGLAFAAVLVLVVTSKVLSPQYLVWVVGLAAAAMLGPDRRHRPAVALVIISASLTQAVFPGTYLSLIHARPAAVLLLAVRNMLLLTALLLVLRRLVIGLPPGHTAGATCPSPTHTLGRGASLEVLKRTT